MQSPRSFLLVRERGSVCAGLTRSILKKISRRPVAFLLIVALTHASILISVPHHASAKNVTTEKPPVTTPPEPFVIPSPPTETNLMPAVVSFASSVATFIKGPDIPAGLGAAHVPTFVERTAS